MTYRLRTMRESDLHAVYAVQTLAYTDMVESLDVLRSRLMSAPDTAWVAENKDGIGAYLVAYPSHRGKISSLGGEFDIAPAANALYIHDLAVAPRMAGQGVAAALVQQAFAYAISRQLTYICLVSVQDSLVFWNKLGFEEDHELSPEQASVLLSYSGPAYYCTKKI